MKFPLDKLQKNAKLHSFLKFFMNQPKFAFVGAMGSRKVHTPDALPFEDDRVALTSLPEVQHAEQQDSAFWAHVARARNTRNPLPAEAEVIRPTNFTEALAPLSAVRDGGRSSILDLQGLDVPTALQVLKVTAHLSPSHLCAIARFDLEAFATTYQHELGITPFGDEQRGVLFILDAATGILKDQPWREMDPSAQAGEIREFAGSCDYALRRKRGNVILSSSPTVAMAGSLVGGLPASDFGNSNLDPYVLAPLFMAESGEQGMGEYGAIAESLRNQMGQAWSANDEAGKKRIDALQSRVINRVQLLKTPHPFESHDRFFGYSRLSSHLLATLGGEEDLQGLLSGGRDADLWKVVTTAHEYITVLLAQQFETKNGQRDAYESLKSLSYHDKYGIYPPFNDLLTFNGHQDELFRTLLFSGIASLGRGGRFGENASLQDGMNTVQVGAIWQFVLENRDLLSKGEGTKTGVLKILKTYMLQNFWIFGDPDGEIIA